MSYTKQTWSDTASSGTPITATRMNHMEDGIKAANDAWDSVSRGIDVRLPDAASPTHKYEYIHLTTWGKLATIQFYATCLYTKPSGSVVQFADHRIPCPLGDVAYCIGRSGAQFFVPVSGGSVELSTACEVGSADWIKLAYITA